jgi:predicted NBD/HSP70 family sugar kinase
VKPGTPRVLRGINDRAALDLLLEHGPLSRSQLGELTGLSKPTTGQLLMRLEAAGLVITSGITNGGPGPRARLYTVNPGAAHVVAGRTIGEYELRTPQRPRPDAVTNVVRVVSGAAASAGVALDSLRHLTIGTPGAFDPTTSRLRYARHLPGWHDPHLLERLSDELELPIHVDNDVNLAALAERSSGAARGVEDFVLLWVDEGLGAAIVVDGRVRVGATGGAGEVGFLPVPGTPLVRDVRRGNAGSFQGLCGGPAVLALARSLGLRATSAPAAVAAALDSPGAGDQLIATLGHRLAVGIAAVVAVLDPTLVVLSGAIGLAGGDRLRSAIAEELASLAATRPRLELAAVREGPVLAGALHTALTAAREDVFDTVRHHASPGSARPVTRRTR